MLFPKESLQIPNNIRLADENFNISSKIDLFLGAQLFLDLLRVGKIQLQPHKIYLQNSVLGYLVGGELLVNNATGSSSCNLAINAKDNSQIAEQVTRFWEVDSYLPTPARRR